MTLRGTPYCPRCRAHLDSVHHKIMCKEVK